MNINVQNIIKDIIPVWNKDITQYENHDLFPSHYRMLIFGSSEDGKTVLLNRLLLTKILDYEIIYIYSPSILQPSYQIFIKGINNKLRLSHILGLYDKQSQIHDVDFAIKMISEKLEKDNPKLEPIAKIIASEFINDIPTPENISKLAKIEAIETWKKYRDKKENEKFNIKIIVIIDDAICYKQDKINKLFVYGRTYGINIIYLSQAFFETNKGQTRTNSNIFILFKQSESDLSMIYRRICRNEISKDDFINFFNKCWQKERGFILIVKRSGKDAEYIDCENLVNEIRKRQIKLYSG